MNSPLNYLQKLKARLKKAGDQDNLILVNAAIEAVRASGK